MKPKRNLNYQHIIAIVHGYSELCLVQHIRSVLSIPIGIYSKKNGKNSIKINDLDHLFSSNQTFNNNFKNHFSKVNYKKNKPIDLKVFTIMDKDDTSIEIYNQYTSGNLFKNANPNLKNLIIPIYNNIDLEDVLRKINWNYACKPSEKGKVYPEIFPVVSNKNCNDDKFEEICNLKNKLKACPDTNMDKFIEACLKEIK